MPQTDNVVVIGGAGFIGKRLTRRLLEERQRVTVVSRSAARKGDQPDLQYRSGDVGDASRMAEVIEGASVVYDLSMGGGLRWEDYEREVIGGAANVARACLKHGVRRLIYTSSIAALYLGGGGTIDESVGNDGDSPRRGMYGRGKSLAERKLLELHASEKLPAVIFRPGVVLGPGGLLVHGALGDRPPDSTCILGWGRGKYPLPCVLAGDVADALLRAKDAPGIDGLTFNLAGDVRPTAAEYVQALRERARRNFRFYPRSLWVMQAGELIRWGLKKLARKPNPVLPPYRDLKVMTMATQLDCSLAKRLLGWAPVSDREEFFRQAIDCHLPHIQAGDVRLESAARAGLTT